MTDSLCRKRQLADSFIPCDIANCITCVGYFLVLMAVNCRGPLQVRSISKTSSICIFLCSVGLRNDGKIISEDLLVNMYDVYRAF